jgi:hypothetical protein
MAVTIRLRSLLILGAIAALGIGAAFAYGSIPDSNGLIHVCYPLGAGGQVDGGATLRVIDPSSTAKNGSSCKTNEAPLNFNQSGPPGQNGTDGTNGTNGVSGYQIVSFDSNLPPEGDGFSGTAQQIEATCPAGKKVLGGGVTTDQWVNSIVRFSGPVGDTKWDVIIQRTNDGDSPDKDNVGVHVYAICATVS